MNAFTANLTRELQVKSGLTAVGVGLSCDSNDPIFSVSGSRWHQSDQRVEPADKWHIGSITKSMTSMVIADQIDNGLYDFDTPFAKLLDALSIHRSHHNTTVRQLLTHTSGLPANFPLRSRLSRPKPGLSLPNYRAQLISDVLAHANRAGEHTVFRYSNVGYAVAGHVAETVAGTDYETLLQRSIFDRYGLNSAGFGAPRGTAREDEPMGHSTFLWRRKPADPFTSKFTDNGPELSAAGGVHMNLSDLLTYGRLQLNRRSDSSSHSLSAQSWDILQTPVMDNYACGLVVEERDWAGGKMLWHNGSNTLWYAQLMLFPATDTVLALVTNNGCVGKAQRYFFNTAEHIMKSLSNGIV